MSFKRQAQRAQAMRLATAVKSQGKQTVYVCRTCGIHMRCTDSGPNVTMRHRTVLNQRKGIVCSSMTFVRESSLQIKL